MVRYFALAVKNSKHRGLRSWLTLLGIFIGVLTVISLITVGDGLKAAVNSQFGVESTQVISVQAGGLNFGPPGSAVVNPLTRDDAEAIERLSNVEYAVPRNLKFGEIEFNDQVEYKYSVSVVEGYEKELYEMMDLNPESGRLLYSGDVGKVFIGSNVADKDKNGFGKEIDVGNFISIEGKRFRVIGILENKGSFILDGVIFMLDSDLESLFNYGDEVDFIGVKVKDKDVIKNAQEDIEKLLRNRRNVDIGEEDFVVSTPEASLSQVNSILTAIQIFIVIIASISIVVGAIGIINTMSTSVVERRKEIGIMKSIGAKNRHIFMQFFIESGFMGLVGGVLGIIFGLILGYLGIQAINSFVGANTRPELNILLIVLSLIASFVIGAVAGIIPALHASRQNPVEVLRR